MDGCARVVRDSSGVAGECHEDGIHARLFLRDFSNLICRAVVAPKDDPGRPSRVAHIRITGCVPLQKGHKWSNVSFAIVKESLVLHESFQLVCTRMHATAPNCADSPHDH